MRSRRPVLLLAFLAMLIEECPSTRQRQDSPIVPQIITWLYTDDLAKASSFLASTLGLKMVFNGGAQPWQGCLVHAISTTAFLGVCDIRPAPTSMNEASVTITLVAPNRSGVDSWYQRLLAKPLGAINVTSPKHSPEFNCYAFNFIDPDADSLGDYRFEVQAFEDPTWPKPRRPRASLPSTMMRSSTAFSRRSREASQAAELQQVTWLYAKDLAASTAYLERVLGWPVVLAQGSCTIHRPPRGSDTFFLGVCDSRPAPESVPPVTYTIVTASDGAVRQWNQYLAATRAVNVSEAARVPRFNIYGFDFFGISPGPLSLYRLSCQKFEDPGWPSAGTAYE